MNIHGKYVFFFFLSTLYSKCYGIKCSMCTAKETGVCGSLEVQECEGKCITYSFIYQSERRVIRGCSILENHCNLLKQYMNKKMPGIEDFKCFVCDENRCTDNEYRCYKCDEKDNLCSNVGQVSCPGTCLAYSYNDENSTHHIKKDCAESNVQCYRLKFELKRRGYKDFNCRLCKDHLCNSSTTISLNLFIILLASFVYFC